MADYHLLRVAIDTYHEPRFSERDAKALTLADGVAFVTLVLADNFAGRCDKFASRVLFASIAFNEPGIVVVRDETDFLAVWLVRVSESGVPCLLYTSPSPRD